MSASPTPTTSPTSLAHNTKNDQRYADLSNVAIQLGLEAGKGRDTQIKFMLSLVDAAYDNVIDLTENKHGSGRDDATDLTEKYVKAMTDPKAGGSQFDHKSPEGMKMVSCHRTCIKLGQWPKGGAGEPIGTVNNLMTIFKHERTLPVNKGKMQDAANALLTYARTQMKRDALIQPDELKTFCFKKEARSPTIEKLLKQHIGGLQSIFDGKAGGGTVHDASPEVKVALASLTKRLRDLGDQRKARKTVVTAGGKPVTVAASAAPANAVAFTTPAAESDEPSMADQLAAWVGMK